MVPIGKGKLRRVKGIQNTGTVLTAYKHTSFMTSPEAQVVNFIPQDR